MPFDRNLPQYHSRKKSPYRFVKLICLLLLIFLLLFIMNYLVKENVSQLLDKQIPKASEKDAEYNNNRVLIPHEES